MPRLDGRGYRLCLRHRNKNIWGDEMSKTEFIAHVAAAGDLSTADAKRMVELVFGEIENGLKRARQDGKLTIGTLGTFTITDRPARTGRHPRTGEEINIAPSKGLRFRPAACLKAAAGC